ncbi:class II aldolase/adducin family protein [Solirhodobacter olei]|uniref:class II aldolase/adducin family protein n=1 Tax=Solirhodobacter olei TaxID=2493082 RepID=UPI000FD7AEED|nr:class II aldolase/adducin family protein [Solirhodobacter olei]
MQSGDAALREEMVAVCRRMNETGINQGTSGNLSIRCEDGILITPSSLPYERMVPADLVVLRPDGAVDGARAPSSEWRFHRDILAARPDIAVVLHCHSLNATALAVHGHGIPAFHYMIALAGGPDIRCSRYETFGTQELSDAALEALEGRVACLLGHHGQISLGTTLDGALRLAVEVETLAAIYVAARVLGEPPVLPEDEIERVRMKIRAMGYGPRG